MFLGFALGVAVARVQVVAGQQVTQQRHRLAVHIPIVLGIRKIEVNLKKNCHYEGVTLLSSPSQYRGKLP